MVASNTPEAGDALAIGADAKVLAATLKAGETIELPLDPERHQYLVSATGAIEANGTKAAPRDGVAITGEDRLIVTALADTELVLVDTR